MKALSDDRHCKPLRGQTARLIDLSSLSREQQRPAPVNKSQDPGKAIDPFPSYD
jgi:hypothetical protein